MGKETQIERYKNRGRIDDSYFRVCKRKQVKTTSELSDILESIQNIKPIDVKFKDAIGCLIQEL